METESPPTTIGADPEAFEAFYRAHLPYVSRYVALRTIDPHTAADLTAEIFCRAISAASTYRRSSGPARAWLTGIARNVVADHARSSAREHAAHGRIVGRRLLDDDATERIVERISAQASGRTLLAHVATLPPGQRDLVELVAVDELSLAAAAKVLGISAGTARVRWHRARRALRQVVGETLPATATSSSAPSSALEATS
ncbi:RNA polymerase sigma factor [Nocardioides sp. Y6]|uniref:RNA polymerase sigma factor n=1 Tax=Nocardioides malaquae TaxID=2773426 RepID=A0ABR9RUI8_9ACTN|nr:RNA polymerase sigma factor [Nocardioides malaquae]MBE7324795.1 RNA polymerase sigma factor [Nocardioides malaquae]